MRGVHVVIQGQCIGEQQRFFWRDVARAIAAIREQVWGITGKPLRECRVVVLDRLAFAAGIQEGLAGGEPKVSTTFAASAGMV
jgi:hypothetical protein